jgi:endonuclease YncB( thermonuclease family)
MWRLVLLTFFWSCAALGQSDNDTIIRPASKPRFQVVDGGTVRFGSQIVRLLGIEAPKGQTCDDGQWHPAPLAKKALEDFIAGRPVTCKQVDFDTFTNRPVAQCFAGDDDLQALMVSAGWAWSFGRYSDRYAPEEREAVGRKLGVHGHRCVPPLEGVRRSATETAIRRRLLPPQAKCTATSRYHACEGGEHKPGWAAIGAVYPR